MQGNGRHYCILIVDDETAHRALMTQAMAEDGHACIEATTHQDTLNLLQTTVPDLILMGANMATHADLTTCRQICAQASMADIPIIVVTDMDDPVSVQLAYDAGATDFITKPLNAFLLRQRVRYILRAGEARQRLHLSEKRLSEAQRIAQLGSWELDIPSGVLHWSDEEYRLLGYTVGEVEACIENLMRVVHPDDIEHLQGALQRAMNPEQGGTFEVEHRIVRPHDTIHVIERGKITFSPEGEPIRMFGTTFDISERKNGEKKLQQAALVFESISEAILMTDAQGVIMAANAAFTEITGHTEDEVRGQSAHVLKSGTHEEDFYQQLWTTLTHTDQWRGEIISRRKNGEQFPAWVTISAIRDKSGETTNYVSVFSDITEIKRSEEQLAFLAHHDALTGLPNRFHLKEQLGHAVARSQRLKQRLALLFIDLDGFKLVNDSLGHAFGDQILQLVTERLRRASRQNDLLARLGGDEFTLVIEDVADNSNAAMLAHKINQALEPPFTLNGHDLFIGASIGISVFPDDGNSVEELLRNADAAMYQAKEEGKGRYSFYSRALTDDSYRRLTLETELRKAIASNGLILAYQPKVDSRSNQLVGAEALVRWNHPSRGPMPPAEFIPLAEKSGLIVPLSNWVLNETCRQIRAWLDWGLPVVPVAVNISGLHVQTSDLVASVKQALATHGVPPELLELEITEDSIDFRQSQRNPRTVLEQLDEMGIAIALDDFGTGYSSLSQLKALPISSLKIDKSFIRDIAEDRSDEAIIKALMIMAHTLGFNIVAEGVETQKQADFLRRYDCDVSQGYLYSRPLSARHFETLFLAARQLAH